MAKKILLGFTVLILGILILLDNIQILNFSLTISKIWPIVLIIFSLGDIIDSRKVNITNSIIFIVGLYFLLYNYSIVTISFMKLIIPIILIIIGLSLIFPKKIVKTVVKNTKNDLTITSIFSDVSNKSESKEFEKATVTSIFGASTLDLKEAIPANGECLCVCTVVFGGMDIIIPDGWIVNTDGLTCIFSGVENLKNKKSSKSNKNILYLTGTVIFGGIEIKN